MELLQLGKRDHKAKECRSKKTSAESNVITSNKKKDSDEQWEVKASINIEEEELALAVAIFGQINYEGDWIVDSVVKSHDQW